MQYPLSHVRCTHQSMPIVVTLSTELRVPVPTVGGIHQVNIIITSTVMVHNLSWLILTLDKSSTRSLIITSGLTGSNGQLLFIFPTAVSLTTITLHYYSDNIRGLPRLRFYAVPDDFDVWDAPTTSYPHVDVALVPPGGEPAGRRNQYQCLLQHKESADVQV